MRCLDVFDTASPRSRVRRGGDFFEDVNPCFEALHGELLAGEDAVLFAELGGQVDTNAIYETFQQLYWGDNGDGLIAHEPFLVDAPLRNALTERYFTAIVTGRPRDEALHTLRLNEAVATWPVLVGMEDAAAKPAPDGIYLALQQLQRVLVRLDGALARARYGAWLGAVRPQLAESAQAVLRVWVSVM